MKIRSLNLGVGHLICQQSGFISINSLLKASNYQMKIRSANPGVRHPVCQQSGFISVNSDGVHQLSKQSKLNPFNQYVGPILQLKRNVNSLLGGTSILASASSKLISRGKPNGILEY